MGAAAASRFIIASAVGGHSGGHRKIANLRTAVTHPRARTNMRISTQMHRTEVEAACIYNNMNQPHTYLAPPPGVTTSMQICQHLSSREDRNAAFSVYLFVTITNCSQQWSVPIPTLHTGPAASRKHGATMSPHPAHSGVCVLTVRTALMQPDTTRRVAGPATMTSGAAAGAAAAGAAAAARTFPMIAASSASSSC